jgi:hypothetical protein
MKLIYTPLFLLLTLSALASAPTMPSSNLHFNAIDGGYINMGWTPGNGARRVIVAKAGTAPGFIPQNGIDYNSSDVFGAGQEVAPGEFIVYDHFSTSFYLTGLSPATTYYFRVFDYNGTGTSTEYLTSSYLSGSVTTSATPTIQTTNAGFTNITNNSVTVNWSNGNGTRRLIVAREATTAAVEPVNSTAYAGNSAFGSGAVVGAGNYSIYNSTGTGTNITNLKQGTQYVLSFYEFNGNSQPQYLTPAYTATVTTRSVPTIAASNLTITKVDGKTLYLSWTNGNGQRRIIVAKKGSDVTATPANGTDYNANASFGLGQQLGAGEYVVYDDNFNAAIVTNLDPATVYYFKVFEYDGTGANTAYLTSSFASVNGSTAITPAVQAQMLPVSNITSTSLRLNFTPGNGRARIIVGRKTDAVNATPVSLVAYTGNGDFGTGTDLGNGNFVIATTVESALSVTNLEQGTTYQFSVFEFNGYDQPLYLAPGASISATTAMASPLPVKLTQWDAIAVNGKVKLQWKTATETNTSAYVVERSADGINYTVVTTVKARGNSQSEAGYNAEDSHPLVGKSYYRLKMTDLDGKFEYAPVRTVVITATSEIKILSNPVQSTLQLQASFEGSAEYLVVNTSGQVVDKGKLSAGRSSINVTALARGNYWIRININGEPISLSFIRQ